MITITKDELKEVFHKMQLDFLTSDQDAEELYSYTPERYSEDMTEYFLTVLLDVTCK